MLQLKTTATQATAQTTGKLPAGASNQITSLGLIQQLEAEVAEAAQLPPQRLMASMWELPRTRHMRGVRAPCRISTVAPTGESLSIQRQLPTSCGRVCVAVGL